MGSSGGKGGTSNDGAAPAFSVIVCTYNRAETVTGAIDAIAAQTWTDFELLVVDDGSTDETAAMLAAVSDPRLSVITRPNGGLSAARNTGLEAAKGDWVIFLDDDDRPDHKWLEVLIGAVDHDIGMVLCGCHQVDPAGHRLATKLPRPHALFPDVSGVFLAGTFAVRREVYGSVGGYAEAIPTSHQTEIMLRLLPELRRRRLGCVTVDEALVDIETRRPGLRPLSQPEDLVVGAEYLIEHHHDTLAAAPAVLADYHSVAGVSAAQIGEFGRSRKHLRAAGQIGGWSLKRAARLGLAAVPPLARLVWRRHYRTTP